MKFTSRVSSGSARFAMKRMEGPSTAPVGVMPRTFGVVLAPPILAAGGLSSGASTDAARARGCWTTMTFSARQDHAGTDGAEGEDGQRGRAALGLEASVPTRHLSRNLVPGRIALVPRRR